MTINTVDTTSYRGAGTLSTCPQPTLTDTSKHTPKLDKRSYLLASGAVAQQPSKWRYGRPPQRIESLLIQSVDVRTAKRLLITKPSVADATEGPTSALLSAPTGTAKKKVSGVLSATGLAKVCICVPIGQKNSVLPINEKIVNPLPSMNENSIPRVHVLKERD